MAPHDPFRPTSATARRRDAAHPDQGPPGWRDRMLRLGATPHELPAMAEGWDDYTPEQRAAFTVVWDEFTDVSLVAALANHRAEERAQADGADIIGPYLLATINEGAAKVVELGLAPDFDSAMAALVDVLNEQGDVEAYGFPDVRPFADVVTDRANADDVERDVALERVINDAALFHTDATSLALADVVAYLAETYGYDEVEVWEHLYPQVTAEGYEPRQLVVLADGTVSDPSLHDGPHKVAEYEMHVAAGMTHDEASIATWGDPAERTEGTDDEEVASYVRLNLPEEVPEGHVRVTVLVTVEEDDGTGNVLAYTVTADVPETHPDVLGWLLEDRPEGITPTDAARLVLEAEAQRKPDKRRKSVVGAVAAVLGDDVVAAALAEHDAQAPPPVAEPVAE